MSEAKSRHTEPEHRRRARRRSARIVALPYPDPLPEGPLEEARHYINRELSWLDFDARVLAQAEDSRVPLLERLRFLAITSSNLDEFYMIRVAALKRQLAERVPSTHADAMTPTEQLRAIFKRTKEVAEAEVSCLRDQLVPKLEAQQVRLVLPGQPLTRSEQRACDRYFEAQLYPLLVPLAIDPAHPFPYISNLSQSIAVLLR
ncbi:MAG: polyphosphate kinase 1, partial [Candidatus Dormibacteria bacterium]